MKTVYKIFFLIIIFIFVSTYSPSKFDLKSKKNNTFFNIKEIIVLNNFLVKEKNIHEKLKHIYDKNIFMITKDDIEKPLNKIEFLEKVEVKKKYPNIIKIKIYETKPLGILFKDQSKYILDSSSNLLLFNERMNFENLPSIFGDSAEKEFVPFFNLLKSNAFPVEEIKLFFYFQVGRWDLQLINNKIIKYPAAAKNIIIKKSIELLKQENFKEYNTIDLRVAGKIIVE